MADDAIQRRSPAPNFEVAGEKREPQGFNLGGVDLKTLIHVGVELIVGAGLVYWVNKKTSSLQTQILELRKQVEEKDQIIGQLVEASKRNTQMIQHLHSMILSGSSVSRPRSRAKKHRKTPRPRKNRACPEPQSAADLLPVQDLRPHKDIFRSQTPQESQTPLPPPEDNEQRDMRLHKDIFQTQTHLPPPEDNEKDGPDINELDQILADELDSISESSRYPNPSLIFESATDDEGTEHQPHQSPQGDLICNGDECIIVSEKKAD